MQQTSSNLALAVESLEKAIRQWSLDSAAFEQSLENLPAPDNHGKSDLVAAVSDSLSHSA